MYVQIRTNGANAQNAANGANAQNAANRANARKATKGSQRAVQGLKRLKGDDRRAPLFCDV
eukprot:4847456-Lingulodinium_polyedra.AAC.1